jgi:hypothetical protein
VILEGVVLSGEEFATGRFLRGAAYHCDLFCCLLAFFTWMEPKIREISLYAVLDLASKRCLGGDGWKSEGQCWR